MAHSLEDVLKRPVITEKSSIQASSLNKYTFEIPLWASKDHVREAFAKYFPDHKVTKVNVATITGKSRRSLKGRTKPVDRKKAIVTAEGEHITYFPEI